MLSNYELITTLVLYVEERLPIWCLCDILLNPLSIKCKQILKNEIKAIIKIYSLKNYAYLLHIWWCETLMISLDNDMQFSYKTFDVTVSFSVCMLLDAFLMEIYMFVKTKWKGEEQ